MPFLKRFNEGKFLELNEDLVREMTIGHPPQREERTLETLSCPRNPTLVPQCLKELFLYFSSPYFQFSTIKTSLFLPNLKIQIEFTILALTTNHLCKENPSLCSTLEPLYYSSYATTVGGIRFINFVDSGPPIGIRIKWRRCQGWCLSADDYILNTCDPHHMFW